MIYASRVALQHTCNKLYMQVELQVPCKDKFRLFTFTICLKENEREPFKKFSLKFYYPGRQL